ncbi:MAG: methionyl-tRNA formyltransferase, partial [Mailhella sp.]
MRIVYMGTPFFAAEILKRLHAENKDEIIAVYTQPDKLGGRGKNKLIEPETKILAKELGIPVYQPEKFRNNPEAAAKLKALNPDILVIAAYGMLLPQEVLDIPQFGAYNVHASLLPKYRGAAPVQRCLLNG